MNCAFCGFGFESWTAAMEHISAAHPEIKVRKPTSKERKKFIVEMIEEKLKGYLL